MPRRVTRMFRAALAATAIAGIGASVGAAADTTNGPWQARLLGAHVVGKDMVVDGTEVGELSSVDYDPVTGTYYLVADDTENASARFYTVRMRVDGDGIQDVGFQGAHRILRTDGSTFPPLSSTDDELADPEALRLDPATRTLYWQ